MVPKLFGLGSVTRRSKRASTSVYLDSFEFTQNGEELCKAPTFWPLAPVSVDIVKFDVRGTALIG